MLCFKQIR